MRKPVSSMKTIAAPRRLAFFYSRPVLSDPTADLLLVALNGAPCRFLRTPTQVMQQSPDMIDVVVDPEAPFDELGHTRTSPQVGVETRSQRTLDEQRLQTALVPRSELRGSSRRGAGSHSRLAVLARRRLPAPHAAPIHAHAPRNLRGQQSLLEQRECAQAPTFQLFWTPGRSHHIPPTRIIGHYLRRTQ
jgi:hypothetical protein